MLSVRGMNLRPRPRPCRLLHGLGPVSALGLLTLVAIGPAIATSPQTSASDPVAGPEHHVGKVVFEALVTPDLATAKQFYSKLFGWTFQDGSIGGMKYTRAFLGDDSVAAMFQAPIPQNPRRQPAWLAFFSVADVRAAQKIALANGATLLAEPGNLLDLGPEAVFADPQGAVFAVLASATGDQPDYLPDAGQWIWSSLMTRDPDKAAAFYKTLFADEIYDIPGGASARHLLLVSGGYARASINALPCNNQPEAHNYWMNYVRVADAAATVAKAVALGGRLLVEPWVDRQGGKVAVVADPAGAALGLLEWPEDRGSGSPQ
jgi:predicted enzyme related to lactoylglutathione lyase